MDNLGQMNAAGEAIETASFAFIDAEVGAHPFGAEEWEVVRRVIHTTGDFDFKDRLLLGDFAVARGVAAVRAGAPIITDVTMIRAGLSARRLERFGLAVHCHIQDEDVIHEAGLKDTTRARQAIDKAWGLGLLDRAIVAVGNAPSALMRLCELIEEGKAAPALIIGVPVGFIAAAEAKERLWALASRAAHPAMIITQGYKGGSTIAVAILHALMKLAGREGA